MGNLTYLFAAFAVIWLAVLLYSFSIESRQKSVERELEMLRAIVDERES
jgi:CcmD family protein